VQTVLGGKGKVMDKFKIPDSISMADLCIASLVAAFSSQLDGAKLFGKDMQKISRDVEHNGNDFLK